MSRPFADVLNEMSGGRVAQDLAAAVTEVTKSVEEIGKSGFLTLKIKIEANGDAMVTYDAEIVTKVPRSSYGKTMFFTDFEGGVHRRDPRQMEMTLRTVHPLNEKA